METNSSGDTVLTQWFERARFEYHPNNPAAFRVLLGLLGNEVRGNSAPTLAPSGVPAVTYIDRDGVVYEHEGSGQNQRIGSLPYLGRVLDAVRIGNRIVVLREQGLQSIVAGQQATTIATFTRGSAEHGTLLAPAGSDRIFYSYARSSDAPMGFTSIAGVIENGAARKVYEAPNGVLVLGPTKDERGMYLINWGGDPGFGEIAVVALDTGAVRARLPFEGYAAAALAPSRDTIAVGSLRPGYSADTVIFYDVNNQNGGPRNVVLPRSGWNVTHLAWARDSRAVYALAYPSTNNPTGELWRVDPATRKAELVGSGIVLDTRLHGVSPDGRWLLTQTQHGDGLIDLTNGKTQSFALPDDAVVAHW